MKFIVISLSLLIVAHADAVHQRNQMNSLDFQERGVRLRLELERTYYDLRHTGEFKYAGNDVSSIVQKYIPLGTFFANAEVVLRSSGFRAISGVQQAGPSMRIAGMTCIGNCIRVVVGHLAAEVRLGVFVV